MGKLLKFCNEEENDQYLGRYVEIVNSESKYFGYFAWVDDKIASDNRYKLLIVPKEIENKQDFHINFIKRYDARKWLNLQ
jgi:hypothetical protein